MWLGSIKHDSWLTRASIHRALAGIILSGLVMTMKKMAKEGGRCRIPALFQVLLVCVGLLLPSSEAAASGFTVSRRHLLRNDDVLPQWRDADKEDLALGFSASDSTPDVECLKIYQDQRRAVLEAADEFVVSGKGFKPNSPAYETPAAPSNLSSPPPPPPDSLFPPPPPPFSSPPPPPPFSSPPPPPLFSSPIPPPRYISPPPPHPFSSPPPPPLFSSPPPPPLFSSPPPPLFSSPPPPTHPPPMSHSPPDRDDDDDDHKRHHHHHKQ